MEIRWPCSSTLIRTAGRHYARHAGSHAARSRSGLLQREFALGAPIGPASFHTQPCGVRQTHRAPFGSHKTGTCLAQIFHRSRRPAGCHPRLSCVASVRAGGEGWALDELDWTGLLCSAGDRTRLEWRPLPLRPSPPLFPLLDRRRVCINHWAGPPSSA